MPDDYVVADQQSDAAGGLRAGRTLLDLPDRPEAIFCFNDRMAMGVYQAAHERGLDIPADLSVIGFDDQPMIADGMFPGLTTLRLPLDEMGAWGVRTLIGRLPDADQGRPTQIAMPCPPITRGSVAAPAAVRHEHTSRHPPPVPSSTSPAAP